MKVKACKTVIESMVPVHGKYDFSMAFSSGFYCFFLNTRICYIAFK